MTLQVACLDVSFGHYLSWIPSGHCFFHWLPLKSSCCCTCHSMMGGLRPSSALCHPPHSTISSDPTSQCLRESSDALRTPGLVLPPLSASPLIPGGGISYLLTPLSPRALRRASRTFPEHLAQCCVTAGSCGTYDFQLCMHRVTTPAF